MEAIRRYVFPIFWLIIFAVIALSLARIAFFPATADAGSPGEDPLSPTAEFDQYAVIPVETGSISSELSLSALVVPDEGTALKATTAGEVNKIWLTTGDPVEKGQRVLQVRYPEEAEPVQEPTAPMEAAGAGSGEPGASEGTQALTPAAPLTPQTPQTRYRYVTLVATETGILRGMDLEEWQSVNVGDTVATISPGTYSIVAELTPEQQLSLLDLDLAAVATLPTSPDPITCEAPDITEDTELDKPAEPQVDPYTGESTTADVTAAQLVCPVPAGTRIVPGLSVEVTVDLGSADNVLTVPTTAVEGKGEAGTVYSLDEATGEPEPIAVTLGLRGDGMVEITDGLTAGQEILQFVPGVDNPDAGMGYEDVW